MFSKVMVALDGSEHSLKAAEHAAEVAKRFGAALHLLTVTKPLKLDDSVRSYFESEDLIGEFTYVLDPMTDEIIHKARDIATDAGVGEVRTATREGKPARSIVDYAKGNKVDLIVLGSRGLGEVEAMLLGSVSHKVSMLAGCTVMIVK
jgi:nucleotide-binding universal stress UspA family protein